MTEKYSLLQDIANDEEVKAAIESMTEKQKAFCHEYLVDLNGTQAAIRAGYSEKAAKEIASENLTKANIKCVINALMKEREKRTEVTQDRVLLELAKIAFADLNDLSNTDPKVSSSKTVQP